MRLLSTIRGKSLSFSLSLCFSVFLIHLTSHCSLLFANWKTNEICWQFMRKTRSQLSFARWNLCNTTKKIHTNLFKLWNTSRCLCVCLCVPHTQVQCWPNKAMQSATRSVKQALCLTLSCPTSPCPLPSPAIPVLAHTLSLNGNGSVAQKQVPF